MLKIFGSLIDKEAQDPLKGTFKWSGFQFMLLFTQMTMCYICAIFGKGGPQLKKNVFFRALPE